jgi:hypothetical protein
MGAPVIMLVSGPIAFIETDWAHFTQGVRTSIS